MKIVIITETFLPSIDGVVTRLTEAIKFLQKNNHDVIVIAPDLGVHEYEGAIVEGLKAVKLPVYRYRPFALPQRQVKKLIEKHDPDIVHVVNPALVGATGVYYAEKLGYPLIASYHTHIPKYLDYYKIKFLKPISWGYFRSLHNKADMNLCTSKAIQDELVEKNFYNVKLWKRGVDINQYHPDEFSDEMRDRLTGGQVEKKLLVFVGRLAAEKEIDKLLPLLQQQTDIRLAIIGDGPEREQLEKTFAGTNTVFTGFMKGNELAHAFASADALVFPSVTETLGLVILEAMASGLPVIAAKSGPTKEQINDGVTGLLFENEDLQSMVTAIDRLNDHENLTILKQNARNEAEKFSWTGPSQQLLEFYEKVLAMNTVEQEFVHG